MEIQELPGITRFIPKILLALTVTVCDEVYKKIAYWLNDMGKTHEIYSTLLQSLEFLFHSSLCIYLLFYPENYRLQSAYENNLIIKMVFVSHSSSSVWDRKETIHLD